MGRNLRLSSSHKAHEFISLLIEAETLELVDKKNAVTFYRWFNQVPINGSENADDVNFFDYQIIAGDNVTHRNS